MPKHPLSRLRRSRLPRPDVRSTAVCRRFTDHCPTGPDDGAAGGELGRDAALAMVEALLFAADEPLTPRRLATAAGLKDAAEARRLVPGYATCSTATAAPSRSRSWPAVICC